MADSLKTSKTVTYTLDLQRGMDAATRTLTFDVPDITPEMRDNAKSISGSIAGGAFKYFFQPNGWRDSDIGEEAFECVGYNLKLTVKSETTVDTLPAD